MCPPLLIFPCTIKSRSSLLVPAHPGGPGKRAVKRMCVCVCVRVMCCGTIGRDDYERCVLYDTQLVSYCVWLLVTCVNCWLENSLDSGFRCWSSFAEVPSEALPIRFEETPRGSNKACLIYCKTARLLAWIECDVPWLKSLGGSGNDEVCQLLTSVLWVLFDQLADNKGIHPVEPVPHILKVSPLAQVQRRCVDNQQVRLKVASYLCVCVCVCLVIQLL